MCCLGQIFGKIAEKNKGMKNTQFGIVISCRVDSRKVWSWKCAIGPSTLLEIILFPNQGHGDDDAYLFSTFWQL